MTPAQLADQAAQLAENLREFSAAAGPVAEAVEPFVFLLASRRGVFEPASRT